MLGDGVPHAPHDRVLASRCSARSPSSRSSGREVPFVRPASRRENRTRHAMKILLLVLGLIGAVVPAAAQDNWPTRPVRVIASQGPGGLSDIWMRAVADELA